MNSLSISADMQSPFHRGEKKIQERLDVRDKIERFGRQVIRDFMPKQHREFYAQPAISVPINEDEMLLCCSRD